MNTNLLDEVPQNVSTREVPPEQGSIDFTVPINILARKFDILFGVMSKILEENKTLKAKVEAIERDQDSAWEEIDKIYELEKDLYATQQYSRRENIEISGIPADIENRDLENFVIHRVLRKIGLFQLEPYEIVACHRLGKSTQTRPANVIVRFMNRKRAHEAIQNRFNLKDFPELKNMFIVENLCPKYKSIFERCKELKTEGKIKAVWSYNGTVHYETELNRNVRGTKVFHLDALNDTFKTVPPVGNGGLNISDNNNNTTNNNNNNNNNIDPTG